MKRIASLLMLAARSTLWKAAGITLASCLTEAGLFLAALSGWQDTVRTAYYEYSNPMGLEGLLVQTYPDGSLASTWFALMPWACGSVLEGVCGTWWNYKGNTA